MSLRVLNVAYPLAPVGPDAPGGAEQILTYIDRALVRAGHDSTVLASAGTSLGRLVSPGMLPEVFDDLARRAAQNRYRAEIRRLLATGRPDLVHLHGLDFYEYLPSADVPVLVTVHLPPECYPEDALAPTRPRTYLHCVSEAQRRACPVRAGLLPTIPNGVDLAGLSFRRYKADYVLALGRICPEKGFHLAIDAAQQAGLRLALAGKVFPYAEHQQYFEESIRPRLDFRRVFLGPVGFEEKRPLLGAARCLVVPSVVPESSSLVAMEALASGTPVIAFRLGALPEIIEDGRTGFLVNTVDEMAAAMTDATRLRPDDCRAAAWARFSADRMTQRYLHCYHELIEHEGSCPEPDAALATAR